MNTSRKVPVAWHMITHRRGRFFISLLGIAFAVGIMFMEIGFSNAINDSQARIASFLNADFVVIQKDRYSLEKEDTFSRIRLQQLLGLSEVASITPLYEGNYVVANPDTGMLQRISVIAFPPGAVPLNLTGLAELSPLLAKKGTILFDRLSRPVYGNIQIGSKLLLGKQQDEHEIVGLIELGPTIRSDGLMIMSDTHWLTTRAAADRLSTGLIKVTPGTDLKIARARIQHVIGDETKLFTPEELHDREIKFVAQATPAGIVFSAGLIVGLFIGVIICYQILFNEVSDNLPQYATVKAIGFSQGYLVSLVMRQAMILGIFGFLPGLAASFCLYWGLEGSTQLLMILNWQRGCTIFVLTLLMCGISGLLAVRKVLSADPAEVF